MGYSCTKAANDTLNAIGIAHATNGNPNILTINSTVYFFERGRENADGAITGALYEMLPSDLCRKAGTVRIEPDGSIKRFPRINVKTMMHFIEKMEAEHPGRLSTAAAML